MQSFCNLRHFRDKSLTEPLAWIPSADNICIAQQFYEIFTSWEKNDHHLTDVVLTCMKTLLCRVDCTIFPEKVYTLTLSTIIIFLIFVYHVNVGSVIRFGSDITFELFLFVCVHFFVVIRALWLFRTMHRCGIFLPFTEGNTPSSYQNLVVSCYLFCMHAEYWYQVHTLEWENFGMLCYIVCCVSSASQCCCLLSYVCKYGTESICILIQFYLITQAHLVSWQCNLVNQFRVAGWDKFYFWDCCHNSHWIAYVRNLFTF